MHLGPSLPVNAVALHLSCPGVRCWPWGLPRLPTVGSLVHYAIKTRAVLVKGCFFIILIGVIFTFESISLDLGLSDPIDTVSVSFGKAPVRCSSPCFQVEQSVSTILWEHTAASPGVAGHPGRPPATWYLHVSYKTSPVVPTVASHDWFPNPLLHVAECWGKAGLCLRV